MYSLAQMLGRAACQCGCKAETHVLLPFPSLCSLRAVANNEGPESWFQRFSGEFTRTLCFSEHEAIDQPVACESPPLLPSASPISSPPSPQSTIFQSCSPWCYSPSHYTVPQAASYGSGLDIAYGALL